MQNLIIWCIILTFVAVFKGAAIKLILWFSLAMLGVIALLCLLIGLAYARHNIKRLTQTFNGV